MKPDMFEKPVTILTGLGVPTPVKSVAQAYRLLCDWPTGSQDRAHRVAVNACNAALNGLIDTETVRSLFVAFGRCHDVLAPDLDELVAISNKSSSNPHIQ